MSDAWLESCGLKKRRRSEDLVAAGEIGGSSYEDRLDLFEDLLEEDTSVFPLLEVPSEVLTAVGTFLDAGQLAELGQLNVQAQTHVDDSLADAWLELLLRDYAFRSRAKRYRAYSAADGQMQRTVSGRAGLVLTAVDLCRVEWDGLLVAAPSHIRYRFMQTLGTMKRRWGRSASSWEWFASRVLRRTTYDQLERFVPNYHRPALGAQRVDEFDEVSHQAALDRDLRQRHQECNPGDVIASMKRSLGIEDQAGQSANAAGATASGTAEGGEDQPAGGAGDGGGTQDDVLAALAPTARDLRLSQAERAANSAAAAAAAPGPLAQPAEMPPQEVVERMSFSEQLDLALRISQASGDPDATPAAPAGGVATAEATPLAGSEAVAGGASESAASQPRTKPDASGDAAPVLLRLQARSVTASGTSRGQPEPLEVVMQPFAVGETLAIPEQLRRPLEQVAFRLSRADWLLLYEGVAAEAQLRARLIAYQCRRHWLRHQQAAVRSRLDLEAELLQLPLYATSTPKAEPRGQEAGRLAANREDEQHLRDFLQAWEEHESWTVIVEEHLGPLDLEVGRERSNNLQRGRAHTPYTADLCRLAFRNFAICEARLFFAVALAIYGCIARLAAGTAADGVCELLERLLLMAEAYSVQDDALTLQRNTLQEYRYYIVEPLKRACATYIPGFAAAGHGEEEDGEEPLEFERDFARAKKEAPRGGAASRLPVWQCGLGGSGRATMAVR